MDEDERRRKIADTAMSVGSARIPSWAAEARSSIRITVALAYALAVIAALDLFSPIPGFVAIGLAGWELLHHRRGASPALIAALVGTAIGVIRYVAFLHG